jgi:hypothetical protein
MNVLVMRRCSMGAKTRQGTKPSKYGKKAGEEVRTEMHHMRSGKHPVEGREQAIAIGLSKARRAGAKVPPRRAA